MSEIVISYVSATGNWVRQNLKSLHCALGKNVHCAYPLVCACLLSIKSWLLHELKQYCRVSHTSVFLCCEEHVTVKKPGLSRCWSHNILVGNPLSGNRGAVRSTVSGVTSHLCRLRRCVAYWKKVCYCPWYTNYEQTLNYSCKSGRLKMMVSHHDM